MSKVFGEQDTAYLACEAYPRGSGEYELLVMAFMSGPINDTLPWDGGTAYLEGDRNRQVRLLPYEIVFASYVECDADDRRRANVRLAATNAAWLAIHSSTDLPIPPFLLSSVPYAALAHLHCTLRVHVRNYADLPDFRAQIAFGKTIPGIDEQARNQVRETAEKMVPTAGDWLPFEIGEPGNLLNGVVRLRQHFSDDVFSADAFVAGQVSLLPSGTQLFRRRRLGDGKQLDMMIATVIDRKTGHD